MDENLEEQRSAEPREQPKSQWSQPEGFQPEWPEEPPRPSSEQAPVKRASSVGLDLYLNVRVLVSMMAVFVLLFTFVVRIIVVSGPSMEQTLLGGDLILVWSLGYTPEQGDIVVLTQESYQEDSIVKRVIATGGQTVDIHYAVDENDVTTVKVDGRLLDEDYINPEEKMRLPDYGEGINHVTVPEGCIFVMGDNRNHSADSRYPAIGIVDTRCVIGRGLMVVFPFSRWKGL